MSKQSKHDEVVEQLDQFYIQAKRQILENQSAITGLFPANSAERSNASIKTSLWAASSIFALYLAYSKRVDNDQGKAHDLGQSVVKCMRGILFAWMRQSENVESFKANQSPKHALHLKFDLHSGLANDFEYPHLQIDVVSLYLIFLANFIGSGLDIIYCMDEVTFIQNLVYYVERAYRTPDYGSWEPMTSQNNQQQHYNSTSYDEHHHHQQQHSAVQPAPAHQTTASTTYNLNHSEPVNYQQHCYYQQQFCSNNNINSNNNNNNNNNNSAESGLNLSYSRTNTRHDGSSLEIHATSIGMAKSALEAINGCNLFGGKGANWSIIYSDIDAHSRNRSIFETLLPRESRSKNTDSYLLATISWPCFATHDPTLYQSTKSKILRKLKGNYGLKRFLRDPYGTVLDPTSAELVQPSPIMLSSCPNHHPIPIPTTQTATDLSYSGSQIASDNNNTTTTAGTNTTPTSECCFRESSFSSTTSGTSSVSLGERPKIKQRKSSYHARKNISRTSNTMHMEDETSTIHNIISSTVGNSITSQSNNRNSKSSLLQRVDSATKMSKKFEHIESEWPLFVCFLIIDGIFKQDLEQICEYEKLLYEKLLKIDSKHGDYLMPKFYYVPRELIDSEKCHPDSVLRLPSAEGSSSEQLYLTGQSILLITRLLLAGLVHPNELDPLRRHMPSHDRPKRIGRYSSFQATSSDLVVQTVLIAESIQLQAMMANYGIQTQTPLEVEPVQIWSSAQLVKVYEYLGVNEKLGLKGRPSRPIGALGTSKLYRICGQTILCYPLIFEVSDFYLAQDMLLLIDDIQNELNFIGRYWRMSGRPTVCILIREEHLRDVHFRDLLDLLVQFKNGQLKKSGLRIKTGRLQNLISSSCIEHLDFLHLLPHEHLPQFKSFRQLVECPRHSLLHANSRTTSFSVNPTNVVAPSDQQHHQQQQQTSSSLQQTNKEQAGTTKFANTKRHLCSASSHNLQAIEEMNSSISNNESLVGSDDLELSFDQAVKSAGEEIHQNHHQQQQQAAANNDHSITQSKFNQTNKMDLFDFSSPFNNQQAEGQSKPSMTSAHDGQMQGSQDSIELEPQTYTTFAAAQSIDYYECYKEAPTWPTLIEILRTCTELSGQSQLLAILWEREGPKYSVDDVSVEDRLERVSQQACQTRNWSVVRYCSAVLKRSVESLSPWLTSILVNGKQISLGTGANEKIINNPLTPTEIHTLIYSTINTKNPCDAVLQQEIALYIGRLISTRPDYFEGILTIRVTNFMRAMRSYLTIKTNERLALLEQHRKLQLQQQNLKTPEPQTENLDLRIGHQQKQAAEAEQQQQQQQQLLDLRMKPSPTQLEQSPPARPTFDLNACTSSPLISNYDYAPSASPSTSHIRTTPVIKVEHAPTTATTTTSMSSQTPKTLTSSHKAARLRRLGGGQTLVSRSLESLSPSDVRKLLVRVLNNDVSLPISDRRQITGELCRVPKDFYDKVWSLLSCTNVGIVIGGQILCSAPILTNMTQDDLNFALKVESLLSSIDCPKLRQVNVELLMALYVILERNPEIRFESDPLDLDKIISLSLEKFRVDFGRQDYGLQEYYTQSVQTTMLYTVRTVFDCLLPIKYKGRAECRLS